MAFNYDKITADDRARLRKQSARHHPSFYKALAAVKLKLNSYFVCVYKMTEQKLKRVDIKSVPLENFKDGVDELTVVIVGSVNASKSTLLGVMANPTLRTDPEQNLEKCLDDGNGKVRNLFAQLPHERESGRTSSIAYTPIYMDKKYWPTLTSNRVIMATDLCGHDRYLKTTVTGVCSSYCDFALLCVDRVGNRINPMTREHIKILMAMNIPFAVIITKIDLQTQDELKHTLKQINKLIRPTKKMFIIKNDKDLDVPIDFSLHVPFFLISCKNGYGILRVMNFLTRISPNKIDFPPMFAIDSIYMVVGQGTVVAGTSGMNIKVGDRLQLGPFSAKANNQIPAFVEVAVRSIHDNYRNNISELIAGRHGCLCIRFSQKDAGLRVLIKSGMILMNKKDTAQNMASKFKAEILVFSGHHTTIRSGFHALCNIGTIRAPAKFKLLNVDVARSDDKLFVELTFPGPICPILGSEFIFREGISVGHGKILEAAD